MAQDQQQTADQMAAQQMEDDPQVVKLAGDFYVAKFFIYLANFVFPGAGGTVGQSITIDSDADFEMLYLTGNATGADATDQSGFITVLIKEGFDYAVVLVHERGILGGDLFGGFLRPRLHRPVIRRDIQRITLRERHATLIHRNALRRRRCLDQWLIPQHQIRKP